MTILFKIKPLSQEKDDYLKHFQAEWYMEMTAFGYKNLMTWMLPIHSRDQAETHFRNQKWHLCLYMMLPLMQVAGEEALFGTTLRTQVLLKQDFSVGCSNWLLFLSDMHARILSTAFWAGWPPHGANPGHLCSMSM